MIVPDPYVNTSHAGSTRSSRSRAACANGSSERMTPTVTSVVAPAIKWTPSSRTTRATAQPGTRSPAVSASTVAERRDDRLRTERAAPGALDAIEELVDDGRRRQGNAEPLRRRERQAEVLLLEPHHEA